MLNLIIPLPSRKKFILPLIVALITLCSFAVKAQIEVTVKKIDGSSFGNATIYTVVAVNRSTFAIDTVRASVNDRSTLLPIDEEGGYRYRGSVDLSGFPDGDYQLKIYVHDVAGNSITVVKDFKYFAKPIVTVDYPVANTAYSSQIRVKAHVTDIGATSVAGFIKTDFGTFNFTNSIDTVLTIPPSVKNDTATVSVSGKDSNNQIVTVRRTVYFNTSPYLTEIFRGDGQIVDFNETKAVSKISAINEVPSYKVFDIANNTSDTIKLPGTASIYTQVRSVMVSNNGVIMDIYNLDPTVGNENIYIWKNGQLNTISASIRSGGNANLKGDHLTWTGSNGDGKSKLYLTNINNLNSTLIDDNVLYNSTTIGSDGNIVYTSNNNLFKYNISTAVKTQLTTDGGVFKNYNPRTDSEKIVYTKEKISTKAKTLQVIDGTTDQAVNDPNPLYVGNYNTAGGYVAYNNEVPTAYQVWLRKGDGTSKRLSPPSTSSSLSILGSKSQVLFTYGTERFFADSVTDYKPVSTNKGNVYYVNGNLYLSTGNVVYKYNFDVTPQSVTIASALPASARKGDTVTITGTNFLSATSVMFGNVPATSFKALSNTTISAVVGTGATGDITVANRYSTATKEGFTFLAAPVIKKFSPSTARLGQTVTITGENFAGVTSVSFGGTNAQSFEVVSPTQIKAVVGLGSSSEIKVVAYAGTATINGFLFDVPTPVITSSNEALTFITGGSIDLEASTGPNYQYAWTLNGKLIPGATGSKYTASAAGAYRVTLVHPSRSITSEPLTITETYTLPADAFTITTTDESCRTSNNGSVKIEAKQALNYAIVIPNNAGGSDTYNFTSSYQMPNLPAGTYSFCISVVGKPGTERCFTATIKQPENLSVYSAVNEANRTVSLALAGAELYHIELNGTQYTTSKSELTLSLLKGDNTLNVTTDKPCQGVITKHINAGYDITLYPNPVEDLLNITLGKDDSKFAQVEVRTLNGVLVYNKKLNNEYGNVRVDLSQLKSGMHVLTLVLDKSSKVFKILKK